MGSGLINILHNCKLNLKLISIIWFAYPALLNVSVMFYMKCWGITYHICCFQVAHFTTPFSYRCLNSIHSAMNGLLPPEIRVREISAARPEFHARSSTKALFRLLPNSKFFHSLSITSIFSRLHGALNVGKKITNCTV